MEKGFATPLNQQPQFPPFTPTFIYPKLDLASPLALFPLITAHSALSTLFPMPSRGRHQSTSKECQRAIAKIEAMPGVIGVIIGRSYGGKSLGQENSTGSIRIQRPVSGGLKAVTQTEKGLQELFIRTEAGMEDEITESIKLLDS